MRAIRQKGRGHFIDVCTTNINDLKKTNVEILTTTVNISSEKVSKTTLRGCLFFVFTFLFFVSPSVLAGLHIDRLSETDIKAVENLLEKLTSLIKEHEGKQNLATLTFSELYAPLNKQERKFLKAFETLNGKKLSVKIPFRGIATGQEDLVVIQGQKIHIEGKEKELPPQFLPPEVYEKYLAMMAAMEKDLGKRLYIESGYRSSAYQLYLLIFYSVGKYKAFPNC